MKKNLSSHRTPQETRYVSISSGRGLLLLCLLLALVLPTLFACGSTADPANSAAVAATTVGTEPSQAKSAIQDKGDFKVVYARVKNQDYAQFQKELQQNKVLEAIATDLNQTLALPFDVTLTFTECGEANAFYDPNLHKISMCYELIEDFYNRFSKNSQEQEEVDDAVANATIFTFFHELGHALVHVYELPITGKEEDAVDQLSTWILVDGTDEGEKAAIDGAASFLEEREDAGEWPFWDEHSMGPQRFYNILCWVYGQNPDKFDSLVKEEILPADRAARCPEEYNQLNKSWSKLLAPYIKK